MKTRIHNQLPRIRVFAALALGLGLATGTVPMMAADKTWDGGGDGSSWSASPANWVGDAAPVFNDRLIFTGSTGLTPNNDFPAGTNFNGIVFDAGAGAFNLSGNALRLGGNITNSSANEQNISISITNTGTRIYYTGPSNLVFSGPVSSSTLQKEGTGAVILGGSVGGGSLGAVVNGGTLILAKSAASQNALGAGVTVNTNAILRINGTATDQIHFNQRVTLNGGILQVQNTNASGIGQFEEIGALSGSNNVASIVENGIAGTTNRLDIGGGNGHEGIYGGTIRDGAGVLNIQVYRHDNKYVFNGTNTYTGVTLVDNTSGVGTARLIMNGIHTGGGHYAVYGRTITTNAALDGAGIISASSMVISNYAALSPGGSLNVDLSDSAIYTDTTGILTISNAVTLWTNTATLEMQLNGTAPGTGYDQVVIAGAGIFTNNGANLKLTLGFTPAVGDKFTLVQIPGTSSNNNFGAFSNINGVVADLSQGATFVESGSGQSFKISYRAEGSIFDAGAGNGNDIMIQAIAPVGGRNLTWRGNGGNNNWDDNVTADWWNGTSSVTFTNGDFARFDDTGTNNSPVNLIGDLTPPTLRVDATKNYTFGGTGRLFGGIIVTKTNTGTLTYVTDNDTSSGSTVIQAGALQVGTNGTTGTISGNVTVGTNGTLIHNRSDDVTFSTAVAGGGAFLHTGSGALVLAVDAPFNGRTTNSGGLLQLGTGVGAAGSIGGEVNVSGASTLRYYYAGDASIANTKSGSGNVIYEAASGNRTYTIPTTLVSSNYSGANSVSSGVRLHCADGNNGYNLGNGGSISVTNDAQVWLDRSATVYNQAFYLAGNGYTGDATPLGAMRIFGCTVSGPVVLADNARIGGSINGGIISGPVSGNFQLEVLGNPGSFILSLSNSANAWGPTLITSGSIRALVPGSVSTNAMTIDLTADLQVFGNNVTVANLNNGPSGAGNVYNMHGTSNGTLTVGTDGTSTLFDGVFANGAGGTLGLTKVGAGTLTLSGISLNTGTVDVNGGTLALTGAGSFGNAANIIVRSGAFYDVTAAGGTLTLNGGQTLGGNGTVTGNVSAPGASTVAPGTSVGTLTVSGDITLAGKLQMEVNRTNTPSNCDHLVSSGGTITAGGVLSVTNIGPALQVNDTFQLFPSGISGFAYDIATTDANGYTYTWTNKVSLNGSIQVLTVTPPVLPVNPTPTNIVSSVSGGNLTLTWPSDHIGWTLQAQTNNRSVGLSTNWTAFNGGFTTTNSAVIPIEVVTPTVFFRLFYQVP